MRLFRGIVIAALLLLSHVAGAQIRMLPREKVDSLAAARRTEWCDERVAFDSLSIHVPAVHEDDAPVMASFRFRNMSRETLALGEVETSCSCVKATFSCGVVEPGEECVVDVVYLQKGHPGIHDRFVYVYLKDEKPLSVLVLHTEVLEKEI